MLKVLLVSQCSKKALRETRRVLDQFAERKGDRTWQTTITQEGLEALHTTLKKTARKNTAVACHLTWSNRNELLWIVGNRRCFNDGGSVPTKSSHIDILRLRNEDGWLTGRHILLLSDVASLFHDFGKATVTFQFKLNGKLKERDAYRHEWVSLRLFEAFVNKDTDESWLKRLATCTKEDSDFCLKNLVRDDINKSCVTPWGSLPPLAQVVGWLILSHHRLPVKNVNARALQYLLAPVSSEWDDANKGASSKNRKGCWKFNEGVPFVSKSWRKAAQKSASAMLNFPGFVKDASALLDNPYVMHLARLALVVADHYYSSQTSNPQYGDLGHPLYANTDKNGLNQRLDEHLCGVADNAKAVCRALPRLPHELPRIQINALRKRTSNSRFNWQNKASDLAVSVREASLEGGFFGVNMASTGCGKTLANAKIMHQLAEPRLGTRFNVAIGLRSLTLQTGREYQTKLHLDDKDIAVVIGSSAVKKLYGLSAEASDEERKEEKEREEGEALGTGSESSAELFEHSVHYYAGDISDSPLKKWLSKDKKVLKLTHAPVLISTVDHLIGATENVRGGKHIAPILRLMTSDLVLDEIDDYGLEDLPALNRLVNWAGMLGSRVLLSSATLPPMLVEGLFQAYLSGREIYQKNRVVESPTGIQCAWFDEHGCRATTINSSDDFRAEHDKFTQKRVENIKKVKPRRTAEVKEIEKNSEEPEKVVAPFLLTEALSLHSKNHTVHQGKRVSFGLCRMANIDPLIDVAESLFRAGSPEGVHVHLCVYHSRHPLVVRSAIEEVLDSTLNRKEGFPTHTSVEKALISPEQDHLFIVLASPVAEVGRDHDYDWAIVEPSSMRSAIQLAGRVRRHRPDPYSEGNIVFWSTNIKGIKGKPISFSRPGFESIKNPLSTHLFSELTTPHEVLHLDSTPRIQEGNQDPSQSLSALEHKALKDLYEREKKTDIIIPDWWVTRAHLTGVLQKVQEFRKSEKESEYAFVPNEDGELEFCEKLRKKGKEEWLSQDYLCDLIHLNFGPRINSWGSIEYEQALQALCGELGEDMISCAKKCGEVRLNRWTGKTLQRWEYHPILGFRRKKS